MLKKIIKTMLTVMILITSFTSNVYALTKKYYTLNVDGITEDTKRYVSSVLVEDDTKSVFINNVNVGTITSDPQTVSLLTTNYKITATISLSNLTCNLSVDAKTQKNYKSLFKIELENNEYYVCYFYPDSEDSSYYQKEQSVRNGDIHNFGTYSYKYGNNDARTFDVSMVQSTGAVYVNGDYVTTLDLKSTPVVFEYIGEDFPLSTDYVDYGNDILGKYTWLVASQENRVFYNRNFGDLAIKQEYDLENEYLNLPKVEMAFGADVNYYKRVDGTSTTGTGVWESQGSKIAVVCEYYEDNECGNAIRNIDKFPRYWAIYPKELGSIKLIDTKEITINAKLETKDETSDTYPTDENAKNIRYSKRTASWSSWSSWSSDANVRNDCNDNNTCNWESKYEYSNYVYAGNPSDVTKWTSECSGPAWTQNSKCGTQYKTCANSECGYNKCQTAACGVASYNSCATSACGVASYKSCATAACGAKVCANPACGYNTCTSSACGVSSYKTCQTSACGYMSCDNAACGAKTCKTSACGCAKKVLGVCISYNSCKNSACGYNTCATSACGAKVCANAACGANYKSCATSACGAKTCQTSACGYMTCDNAACGANYKTCQAVACGVNSYVSCIHSDCGVKTCQTSACGTETLSCYLYSCPTIRTTYYRAQQRTWNAWTNWTSTSTSMGPDTQSVEYKYMYDTEKSGRQTVSVVTDENSKTFKESKNYGQMSYSDVENWQKEYAEKSVQKPAYDSTNKTRDEETGIEYKLMSDYKKAVSYQMPSALNKIQNEKIYSPYLYFWAWRFIESNFDLPSGTAQKYISVNKTTCYLSNGDLIVNEEPRDRKTKVIYFDYHDPLTNYDEIPENWQGYEDLLSEIENSDMSSYKIKVKISGEDLAAMKKWIKDNPDKLNDGSCQILREFSYIFIDVNPELAEWLASGDSCEIKEENNNG